MITAHLIGRLGNAMFQIAAVHVLAKENNDEYAFNLRAFGRYKDNIFKKLKDLDENWKERVCYEYAGSDYKPIQYKRDMAIIGYFQSDKYFSKYRDEIIDLFNIPKGRILNSVSVHVRRGDYLAHQDRHLCPTMYYYNRALAYVDARASIEKIYVTSDDIPWCKENFTDERVSFIDWEDYDAIVLMSQCEHNIIANSSFSWWGSYLNQNEEKIVISPNYWIKGVITPDIFRDDMILL